MALGDGKCDNPSAGELGATFFPVQRIEADKTHFSGG